MPVEIGLPDIRAQGSINEVLNDVYEGKASPEEFWVEIGGKEERFLATKESKLSSRDGSFTAMPTLSAMQVDIYNKSEHTGLLRLGQNCAALPKTWAKVTCGDVFGTRVIVGDNGGGLHTIDLMNPESEINSLEGHLLDTSVAKFFPSGKVALSAGMDFTIKIWDLDTGAAAQKLFYKSGVIDDIALIGKGRNLLSLSKKAEEVVLWEVGKAQVLNTYSVPGAQCLGIYDHNQASKATTSANGSLYDADGRSGLVGTSGAVLSLDFRAPGLTPLIDRGCECLSIENHTVAAGSQYSAAVYDLRMAHEPVFTLTSPHPVESVALTPSKAYIQTSTGIYGHDSRQGYTEVLCTDIGGVITTYNKELWHIGYNAVRHFPF